MHSEQNLVQVRARTFLLSSKLMPAVCGGDVWRKKTGHVVGNGSSYIFTLLFFFIAQPMSLVGSAAILGNWPKAEDPPLSKHLPTSLQ